MVMFSCADSRCSFVTARPGLARSVRPLAWLLAGLLLQAGCLAAPREGIFLIGDDPRAIHLSDQALGPAARLLVAVDARTGAALAAAPVLEAATSGASCGRQPGPAAPPTGLAAIVQRAGCAQGVDPDLLHAVIAAESGYARRAVSPRGAQGLMQLMPATARGYGVTDPFDARQNIDAGAQHLRRLLDQFGQDTTLALAAYNAGAGAVIRYQRRVPPYAETLAYVPRVLRRWAELRRSRSNPVGARHAPPTHL